MKNYFPDPTGWADYQRQQPKYQNQVKLFAERLHSEFCRLGHDDNCTWFFENDWENWAHKHWLAKAVELKTSGLPEDAIVEIGKILRTI